MPVLSTSRGHIGASYALLHLSYADFDPAKTRKESRRSLSASSVRWPGHSITHNADGPPESVGKNEKSIWEHYNEMAAVEDNIREVEWRDLADTILVFVCLSTPYGALLLIWLQDGLFAAFLSAFLVFTIPQLQPNSTDIAMDVLIHISQQLSNSTTPAYTPTEFTVSPSIATVNVLFFLSLALVLIDAFLAMLVKSWLQEFDHGWRKYTVAKLRAQERERRLQGLERWKLAELVVLLPILIQASLLFFCIGLLVLLFPIHLISSIFSSIVLFVGFAFYVFTTYVSMFDTYAPFSSPVSRGLMVLTNAVQTTWMTFVHRVQDIISSGSFHISHPLSPLEPKETINHSTQPLPGSNCLAQSHLPQSNTGINNWEVVPHSQSQIDHQIYVHILEQLVTRTAQAVENIPLFLELLDQPVKDPTLRLSSVEVWKHVLNITLELLEDSSTLSDPAAQTLTRTMLFCYHDLDSPNEQLSRRLKYHFGDLLPCQTDKRKPLNSLFASCLDYYCDSWHRLQTVNRAIAFLEPSNAADMELLWMVNTIHKYMRWRGHWESVYDKPLGFFTAVLTYVSSTEQSRRSQVPLTAAVIHSMHAIMSALNTKGIGSIDGHYVIPTVRNTFKAKFVTFDQVDPLDLWSPECTGLASALLQLHTHWLKPRTFGEWNQGDNVSNFQFTLISALYIDSTERGHDTSAAFADLLELTTIPNITKQTLKWADAYDQTKLASYLYMAIFQQRSHEGYITQDIGFDILQSIADCSEIRLSALHLLDFSAKHICAMASSPSTVLTRERHRGCFTWITPGGGHFVSVMEFKDWVLLHLDTLFYPSAIIFPHELARLEWDDTPEQMHIARSRLALYDQLQGEETKQTKQLRPEPHLLKLCLQSNDYKVCTGAFKWCLNLATTSSPGDVGIAGIFTPEAMGCQQIEHLMQVLFGLKAEIADSWEFLNKYLVPKWGVLPPAWCHDFASVFMFTNVYWQPAYQLFTQALIYQERENPNNQAFLPFIVGMLEPINHMLNWDQLTSLRTGLAWLPDNLQNQDAQVHVKLENLLATRVEQIVVDETLRYFVELLMTYPEWSA